MATKTRQDKTRQDKWLRVRVRVVVGKEEAHQQKICKDFALRSQLQTTFVNSYKRGEGGGSGRVEGK